MPRKVSGSQQAPARPRTGPLNSVEAEERKQRILAAARALFVAHGLGGASFNAIANAAHVTKRTLYMLYRSKEGLFVAALEDCVDAIAIAVRQMPNDQTDLTTVLIEIAESYARALNDAETLAMYRLAIGESARIPIEARHAINLYGEHSAVGVVTQRLQAAQAKGLVRFKSLPTFVHLFLDVILAPQFVRWLIGEDAVPNDIPSAVRRFLKGTDDLFKLPQH